MIKILCTLNMLFPLYVGSKNWLNWRREIELLSDLSYFSLTTFSGIKVPKSFTFLGFSFECFFRFCCQFYLWLVCLFSLAYQTLGEEYVHIIQVDPTKRRIPSRSRRSLFIFCHVFFPYLLDKVLVCLENELEGGPETHSRLQTVSVCWSLESWLRKCLQKVLGLMSEPQRRNCLPTVFILQQSLGLLHRVHVALFYTFGSFYSLSKRSAGISYVCGFVFLSIYIYFDYSSSFMYFLFCLFS